MPSYFAEQAPPNLRSIGSSPNLGLSGSRPSTSCSSWTSKWYFTKLAALPRIRYLIGTTPPPHQTQQARRTTHCHTPSPPTLRTTIMRSKDLHSSSAHAHRQVSAAAMEEQPRLIRVVPLPISISNPSSTRVPRRWRRMSPSTHSGTPNN